MDDLRSHPAVEAARKQVRHAGHHNVGLALQVPGPKAQTKAKETQEVTASLDAQVDLRRLLDPYGGDYQIEIVDDHLTLTIEDDLAVTLYRPIRKIALRHGINLQVISDDIDIS